MDVLREVLATSPPPPGGRPWRLLFTGHSLGGALASLAAYDAVQLCRGLPAGAAAGARVLCYTFGAPRPGNHAFARDYRATVPASFDVIHCDDTVTRNGEACACAFHRGMCISQHTTQPGYLCWLPLPPTCL